MDNQQRPNVWNMELCSMLYGSLDGRGSGGKWIHVYLWLSLFSVYLKLPQCCSSVICQYKMFSVLKKFFKGLRLFEISSPENMPSWSFIELWGGLDKAGREKPCSQKCLWQRVGFFRHNLGRSKSRKLHILVRSFLGQVFTQISSNVNAWYIIRVFSN